jgi:hypothetical protein
VKYALQRWRQIAQQLLDTLGETKLETGPLRRGLQAAGELTIALDQVLATPFFREVSTMDSFPSSNQVLHKQEGYREIFSTFALAELGASLAMDWDIRDVFSASQRNVATLYEYWAFLQLVDVLGTVCGSSRTVDALVPSGDGLSLGFRQGARSGVSWETEALGRRLFVEAFFNRSFTSSSNPESDSSWSRGMRPDCSVRIRPMTDLPVTKDRALEVWLHFDAKYRVERAREQFDSEVFEDPSAARDAEVDERVGRSKREDLLKMHAYRDAIRRSAGAYVLFPGTAAGPPFREFAELLPGLGAFILRPAANGSPIGRETLREFLAEALEQVADRASQFERERYWRAIVRAEPRDPPTGERPLPPLDLPPRDATVLCVALNSPDELAWTTHNGALVLAGEEGEATLTADGSELGAVWILLGQPGHAPSLWLRDSAWSVQSETQLKDAGYRGKLASVNLCARVTSVPDAPAWLGELDLALLTREGRRLTTWADLLAA